MGSNEWVSKSKIPTSGGISEVAREGFSWQPALDARVAFQHGAVGGFRSCRRKRMDPKSQITQFVSQPVESVEILRFGTRGTLVACSFDITQCKFTWPL